MLCNRVQGKQVTLARKTRSHDGKKEIHINGDKEGETDNLKPQEVLENIMTNVSTQAEKQNDIEVETETEMLEEKLSNEEDMSEDEIISE